MALGAATLRRLGRTPEARVRWLVAFASQALDTLSRASRRDAWDVLFRIQSRQPVRVPFNDKTVIETHRELHAAIEALANKRPYRLWVPGLSWVLHPPARRPVGARHSGPVVRQSSEAQIGRFAMPAMVVLAFV